MDWKHHVSRVSSLSSISLPRVEQTHSLALSVLDPLFPGGNAGPGSLSPAQWHFSSHTMPTQVPFKVKPGPSRSFGQRAQNAFVAPSLGPLVSEPGFQVSTSDASLNLSSQIIKSAVPNSQRYNRGIQFTARSVLQ